MCASSFTHTPRWTNQVVARTVYNWLQKHSHMDVIKLPAFEYLHQLETKQVRGTALATSASQRSFFSPTTLFR